MAETGISPYARALSIGYPQPYQSYSLAVAPPANKPSIWGAYREALLPTPQPTTAVQSAVAGLRGNLESAALASLLGIIYGKFGTLDVAGKYPVDGILAALLYAMSVNESGKPDGFATDLRNMSQACTAVACFRKTSDWSRPKTETADKDSASGMSRHIPGEDPLVAAAKKLGLAA